MAYLTRRREIPKGKIHRSAGGRILRSVPPRIQSAFRPGPRGAVLRARNVKTGRKSGRAGIVSIELLLLAFFFSPPIFLLYIHNDPHYVRLSCRLAIFVTLISLFLSEVITVLLLLFFSLLSLLAALPSARTTACANGTSSTELRFSREGFFRYFLRFNMNFFFFFCFLFR